MKSFKNHLLSTAAVVPLALGLVAGAVGLTLGTVTNLPSAFAASCNPCNPCAAKKACNPCNPCAAKKCNPCNPCAAKKCNPCNPCAAKKACNPCNPCAAKKACNPCNPCAAKKACNPCNPCAAKKACNPCNPCAAKKACNPCNPCAAKKACNPCNPCAAKKACNPCNPCAAGGGGAAATSCYVPRMKKAAACNPCAAKKACNPCNPCAAKKACNPCNPCAAKKACNPCNPCAAKKACNPCNPCAAKKACNPCNPCAAKKACNPCNPCAAKNPCNPCAAAPDVELSAAEMGALYDCLKPKMQKAYNSNGHWAARKWGGWKRFSKTGYRSDTHGGRFVQNYANKIGAKAYGRYDKTKKMPVGSTLAKPSFTVGGNGQATMGPLFIMEKMTKGWNKATSDWRYAMIMPGGNLFGITKGKNSGGLKFCATCHSGAEDNDFMFFLPDEYRK